MSKLSRLRDNIAVIEFILTQEGRNSNITDKYTGFGGLGVVLNPLDRSKWSKSDLDCYEDTVRLHELLKEESSSDREYNAWVQSLKASVLTAYYTPEPVVEAIMDAIYGHEYVTLRNGIKAGKSKKGWIKPKTFLDPAAGGGVFMKAVCSQNISLMQFDYSMTAFEKDLLTAMLLKRKWSSSNAFVYADGFENFPKDELGMYDLVSTNVPFGDIAVFDDAYTNSNEAVRREAAKMIHRYYVLKGLDCLRDGGVLAYIITSNYLNRDGEQIAEALRQSRLIGAYRLANNLFKENGTEVGTDLLVLQKDTHKDGLTADESFLLTQYESEGCPTNMYFDCYPERVIATSTEKDTDAYGKKAFVYTHKDGVTGISKQMGEVLAKDMAANLSVELFEKGGKGGDKIAAQQAKPAEKKAAVERKPMTKKEQQLADLFDSYRRLYEYEVKEQQENTDLRKKVNTLYDAFRMEWGPLNHEPNKTMAKRINKELLALEIMDEGAWAKADIFTKPVAFATEEKHEVVTAREALAQSLNEWGRPSLAAMCNATGMTEEEVLTELEGELYSNPLNGELEIKARFVSGNVVEKLESIKAAYPEVAAYLCGETAEHTDGKPVIPEEVRILHSMRALQDAIPAPIPFEELDFNLGERWIDADLYGKFATEFFGMGYERPSWESRPFEVTVRYNALLDQFTAAASYTWGNENISTKYAVSPEAGNDLNGIELFIHGLHNSCPKLYKYKRNANGGYVYNEKYEKEKVEDPEKTQLANTKIEEIRAAFVDWLQRQPKEERDKLADVYNRRFNCFCKPKYDGSHQTFPDLDRENLAKNIPGFTDLYQSQKDCIWMLLQNGGGICDHEVGGGKTLIMCVAAHEMKRLGLCHKPMIIGLKANVGEIARTYQMAYPKARVLFAEKPEYKGMDGRADFINQAKNNDWDVVVMSHDSFGRIPQSDDIQKELLEDELQQLEDALDVIENWDWENEKRVRKGLERRKRNLEAKLLNVQNAIRKRSDDVVDFAMLGIDHIFVDESHQFKNLGFTTRHDRVAGLGNNEGSQRAFNLLMAIRTIQKRTGRDLGATFLSGTTVTNSLTELYSLFRYLRPQALAKQNITCFDAWAAIFTKKTSEYEFSITNQIVMKERFRYFIKVPELAMFYNEITDFRTAEDVGIFRPDRNTQLLNIEPTPDQEAFIHTLMEFARTGNFRLIGIDNPTKQQEMAKMLYATDLARKMSLDMRLIDPSYSDHPRSKVSQCCKLVKKYYDLYDGVKGTQMIFSDLSAYDPSKWNVYQEIKRKLVQEYHIPEKEIRFIQEGKCESKKQKLIDAMNRSEVRILLGSTTMLGTGVNAQKRVVAIHHLDTPWRPSDLEQRDGRAIRKGNEVAMFYADNKVDIIIYAVEKSLDSYKFNLLHNKQLFIQQLKRSDLSIRTFDEGAMDEKGGMNFAEYMAILSGNTDLLERAKLEKKIAGLEAERKNFMREQRDQRDKQEWMRSDNEAHRRNIASAEEDWKRFSAMTETTADGATVNTLTIDGFTVPDGFAVGSSEWASEIGKQLFSIERTLRTDGQSRKVGDLYGFPIVVRTQAHYSEMSKMTEYTNRFFVEGTRLMYSYNDGYLNHTSARLSAEFPLKAIQRIPEIVKGWQQRVAENESRIKQLDTILSQSWPKEDELRQCKADLHQLDKKINEELTAKEKKAA